MTKTLVSVTSQDEGKTFGIIRELKGEEARQVYNDTRSLASELPLSAGLNYALNFDEEKGIIANSNVPWSIVVNQVLAQKGMRTPTYQELKSLEDANSSFTPIRDTGVIVYSTEGPNKELARNLVEQSTIGRNLAEEHQEQRALPQLYHPSTLQINRDGTLGLREDLDQKTLTRLSKEGLVLFGEQIRPLIYNALEGIRTSPETHSGARRVEAGGESSGHSTYEELNFSERGGRRIDLVWEPVNTETEETIKESTKKIIKDSLKQ